MTRDEKSEVLGELRGLEYALKGVLAQVEAMQRRLQAHDAQGEKTYPTPPPEVSDPDVKPPLDEELVKCPRCQSPMTWRFSKTNGQWFLGCSKFRETDCRGSLSYEKAKLQVESREQVKKAGQDLKKAYDDAKGQLFITEEQHVQNCAEAEERDRAEGPLVNEKGDEVPF